MISDKQFWDWFIKNNSKYFFLNQINDSHLKEKLLNDFLEKLHSYCDNLFFLIGGFPDEEQELIITAEGNKQYFSKVIELTASAPNIKDWKIIPFKQPKEIDFVTNYKNLSLDPRVMWFLPLANPDDPNQIGLRVCTPNFITANSIDFLFATNIVLDNILGERSFAEDITYLEVDKLPSNPEHGFIKLAELPMYISWVKSKA